MSGRRILRCPEVEIKTGLSKPTIYRKMRDPAENWPRPVNLGPNSRGWFEDEIDAWLESRQVAAQDGA
ncbi:MAG: AlpA family phage regulatory protein [Gammaproteobacteria bacterium]|nr:AlpA family phage regulatory protein [Gammaproteobacteria bacterium]